MPSIGHLFYGLCILIPVIYYARDKFNYKVAFIFLANNYLGPDAAQVWIGMPFHSILGFVIFAVPLSLFYSYFSRFSLIKVDKFKLRYIDDKIRTVTWKNSYLLTVAGGISHFFIDQFYHWEQNMMVWPGIDIHHDVLLSLGGEAYHVVSALMIIGFILIIISILLSLCTLKMGWKETLELFLIMGGLTILIALTLGMETFGGERDLGVLVHSIVYVLIPLFCLFYVARDVNENPNLKLDEAKISRTLLLKIISVFSLVLALGFFILALVGIMMPEIIGSIIADAMGEELDKIMLAIQFLGLAILIASSFLIFISIGLFFKNNACRKGAIGIFSAFLMLGFPFAIALFLCEEDVKSMFLKEKQEIKEDKTL